jgi:hypothetical protein
VPISKFHQGIKFISNGAIGAVLDVIRPPLPLPPFLQGIGADAKKAGSADFLEHGIIVICRERPGLDGNMCVGIYKEWMIARVGEAAGAKLFKEKHAKPMDITGKPMKGWAMIAAQEVAEDADLKRHTESAIAFVKTLPGK